MGTFYPFLQLGNLQGIFSRLADDLPGRMQDAAAYAAAKPLSVW